jgi:hypothetical protein
LDTVSARGKPAVSEQRRVCRRWEACSFLQARRQTSLTAVGGGYDTIAALPYQLHLKHLDCSEILHTGTSAMVSNVLKQHLADMPHLLTLVLNLPVQAHMEAVVSVLQHATQLTRLTLMCDDATDATIPVSSATSTGLQLTALKHLELDTPGLTADDRALANLFASLSTMQQLTCLSWTLPWQSEPWPRGESSAQLLSKALPSLPRLQAAA